MKDKCETCKEDLKAESDHYLEWKLHENSVDVAHHLLSLVKDEELYKKLELECIIQGWNA